MMNDSDRIEEIKKRIGENQYFLNPHSDVNVKADVIFLLELLEKKERKISVLSTQVLELSQEIENVKSDFGGMR